MEKFLFLISLPETPDFQAFQPHVDECAALLRERNATIRNAITPKTLADAAQFDAVIVIAHHETDTDRLMLADGPMTMEKFINALPEDFHGVLDLASCHSRTWFNAIKQRCPDSLVQVAGLQTNLAVRLFLYPYQVQLLQDDPTLDYYRAYNIVLDMMVEAQEDCEQGEDGVGIDLGQPEAKIFTPNKVAKGTDFVVRVVIYYDDETGRASIKAMIGDGSATELDPGPLKTIDLKKDDIVTCHIDFHRDSYYIHADSDTKEITWKDKTDNTEFICHVSTNFPKDSFLTTISISKGEQTLRVYSFMTAVTAGDGSLPLPCLSATQDKKQEPDIRGLYLRLNKHKLYKNQDSKQKRSLALFIDEKTYSTISARRIVCNNELYFQSIPSHIDRQLQYCESILDEAGNLPEQAKEMNVDVNSAESLKVAVLTLAERIKENYQNIQAAYEKLHDQFVSLQWNAMEKVDQDLVLEKDDFQKIEQEFLQIIACDLTRNDGHLDMIDSTMQLWRLLHAKNVAAVTREITRCIDDLYKPFIDTETDKGLIEVFKELFGLKSDPKLFDIPREYQGLACYIAKGEIVQSLSVLNINVSDNSVRTTLNRINKIAKELLKYDHKGLDLIKQYAETEEGRTSIIAYRLLTLNGE